MCVGGRIRFGQPIGVCSEGVQDLFWLAYWGLHWGAVGFFLACSPLHCGVLDFLVASPSSPSLPRLWTGAKRGDPFLGGRKHSARKPRIAFVGGPLACGLALPAASPGFSPGPSFGYVVAGGFCPANRRGGGRCENQLLLVKTVMARKTPELFKS